MELWTIQLAQWRVAQAKGVPLIDTTVKTGRSFFKPSWEIVLDVKSGKITEEEYTQRYLELMRQSYREQPSEWIRVCRMETVAIGCMCPAGVFCHRHLLSDCLRKLCESRGIPFRAMGELSKATGKR